MKKLISIVMAMVMTVAIGINVLAADEGTATKTPEIKVYTSAVPTENGKDATFTVKLTNFDGVKGVKLTITAESGVTFTNVAGDDNLALTKDSNYKLSDTKIVIADVTKNVTNATITVTATATDDAKIILEADLAKDGKNLYGKSEFTLTGGTVLVKPSVQNVTENDKIEDTEDYFIPYGSLGYTDDNGNFVSINKKDDGSFESLSSDKTATYSQYKKAENGVMTFGYSDKERNGEAAYQFGSWVKLEQNTSYGTMVVAGEYTTIMEYYRDSKGYTEKDFLKLISDKYDEVHKSGKYVKMNCTVSANTVKSIRVYKFENKTKMWEDANKTERQFALQIYNLTIGEEYVGIAYSVNDSTTTFSETAQYVKYEANNK